MKNKLEDWKKEAHPTDWYTPIAGMKTLILGSFPPADNDPHLRKTRDYQFYYPNNKNNFWRALSKALSDELDVIESKKDPVAVRRNLMRRHKIGIENMGKTILRKGRSSRDNDIKIIECHDIFKILTENINLTKIILPGYSGPSSTYNTFISYLLNSKHKSLKNVPARLIKPKPNDRFEFRFNNRTITCVIINSTSPLSRVSVSELALQFKKALSL